MAMGRTGSLDPHVAPDVLDATLREIIDTAQQAYPAIEVPFETFVAYLRERIPADVPESVALTQMHTADLYLACACAAADERAFAAFDDRCLPQLDRVLFKMGLDAQAIADIKQDIRGRVLVGDGRPPQITAFSGRGDLRGWVRVMAVRWALQGRERDRRNLPLDDDKLLHQLVGAGNPQLEYEKRVYRDEFHRAFAEALHGLPDRERTLLRQHHIDGLTVDELGALYRVHRATAARLLVRARLLVLEATRARLMARLDVQSHDLDSIIRLIRSQLEISLRGLRRRRKR